MLRARLSLSFLHANTFDTLILCQCKGRAAQWMNAFIPLELHRFTNYISGQFDVPCMRRYKRFRRSPGTEPSFFFIIRIYLAHLQIFSSFFITNLLLSAISNQPNQHVSLRC
ncbi:hypothetical protein BDV25DRAFT_107333 [Aspergillus avenaceus]|uniref:Uncharacterized protein n=1 Tax=Aspergillus avenaceus TaxID=36643 RepID=A0A5N6TX76_ASPAV|nr:hypothetical protein BDV25DRAFT_107333 [Aspergillus avenaceus]